MKKKLLLGAFLMGSILTTQAQTVLFEDNFDSYNAFIITGIGDWTQIDVDGAPTYNIQGVTFENTGYTGTAIVFDPAATTPALAEWAPHSGANTLNFFAAVTQNQENPELVGPNNDWFITPQISLGDAGNSVSFWAKSITAEWGLERIKVAVSTTGNTDPADFTVISGANAIQVPVDWTELTYSLDAYADQDVYIAINYLSDDSFALLVDDFSVTTTGVVGIEEVSASKLSVYPNPVKDVVNIANVEGLNNVKIVDLNGRTVKSVNFNGASEASINVSDLTAGVYMMNIATEKGASTQKIVKQ